MWSNQKLHDFKRMINDLCGYFVVLLNVIERIAFIFLKKIIKKICLWSVKISFNIVLIQNTNVLPEETKCHNSNIPTEIVDKMHFYSRRKN